MKENYLHSLYLVCHHHHRRRRRMYSLYLNTFFITVYIVIIQLLDAKFSRGKVRQPKSEHFRFGCWSPDVELPATEVTSTQFLATFALDSRRFCSLSHILTFLRV